MLSGAILVGNTNVSELGMWWESDNHVYGRTNNPYDTRRTPGGSSGGEVFTHVFYLAVSLYIYIKFTHTHTSTHEPPYP